MSATPADKLGVDSLRISDRQWYRLLDQLDRPAAKRRIPIEARRDERVAYRNMPRLPVTIQAAKNQVQRLLVRPRNLSRSGMGFLHGSYLPIGQRLTVHLMSVARGLVRLEAQVRRCSHIDLHVHEIGVAFDESIELEDFLLFVPEAYAQKLH